MKGDYFLREEIVSFFYYTKNGWRPHNHLLTRQPKSN